MGEDFFLKSQVCRWEISLLTTSLGQNPVIRLHLTAGETGKFHLVACAGGKATGLGVPTTLPLPWLLVESSVPFSV